MTRNNMLLLLNGILIMLSTTRNLCQAAATHLANIAVTGGTISTPGSYYLGFDVTGEVTISTSNVILDLNGHLVTGSISVANGLSDVAIMNGFATHNSNASVVSVDNCNNIQLSNITIRNSAGPGITITSSTNIIIEELVCCGPNVNTSCGIELNKCSNTMVRKCLCRNWNTGIAVIGKSKDTQLEECHVSGTTNGMHFIESSATAVFNCTSFSNDKGFLFEKFAPVQVFNCIADNNQTQGFATSSAFDLYLTECLAFRNTEEGFIINNSMPNFVRKCVAINNGTGFFDSGTSIFAVYTTNYANANSKNYNVASTPFNHLPANQKPTATETAQFWRNTTKPETGRFVDCAGPG